jgi:hypothetical protein
LTCRHTSPRPSRRRVGHSFYRRDGRRTGWWLRLLVALMTLGSLSNLCHAAEALNFYDSWIHQPIVGLSAGAYGNWSEDDKKQAWTLIIQGCVRASFDAGKAVAQQGGSDRQQNEELQTIMIGCVAVHLPEDYPGRERVVGEAMKHYQAATVLGAQFPAPTFDALVKSP